MTDGGKGARVHQPSDAPGPHYSAEHVPRSLDSAIEDLTGIVGASISHGGSQVQDCATSCDDFVVAPFIKQIGRKELEMADCAIMVHRDEVLRPLPVIRRRHARAHLEPATNKRSHDLRADVT
jgi:hypothetical protein